MLRGAVAPAGNASPALPAGPLLLRVRERRRATTARFGARLPARATAAHRSTIPRYRASAAASCAREPAMMPCIP